MPSNVVDNKEDEDKWEEAEQQAEDEGHGDDHAYIMSIYKDMCPDGISDNELPDHCGSKTSSRLHDRLIRLGSHHPDLQPHLDPILDRLSRSKRADDRDKLPQDVVDAFGAAGLDLTAFEVRVDEEIGRAYLTLRTENYLSSMVIPFHSTAAKVSLINRKARERLFKETGRIRRILPEMGKILRSMKSEIDTFLID